MTPDFFPRRKKKERVEINFKKTYLSIEYIHLEIVKTKMSARQKISIDLFVR